MLTDKKDTGGTIPATMLLPSSVDEAVKLLADGFRPVGGGTDLMVRNHAVKKGGDPTGMKLFSCRNIQDTQKLFIDNGIMTAGSSTTLSDIIEFKDCPELLRVALRSIASPGIRNTATLAGNICNASPAADSLPALYVLDAEIKTAGNSVERTVPIGDFILAPGKTALAPDEIVISVSFRLPKGIGLFRKVGTRAANALSKLSVAAVRKTDAGIFTDFRLAVGACAPTVVRSREAEALIIGQSVSNAAEIYKKAAEIYAPLIKPIDDQRSTAVYRKNTALRLIENIICAENKSSGGQ